MLWRALTDREVNKLVTDGYDAFEAKNWPVAGELLARAASLAAKGKRGKELWFDAALAYKFAHDWQKACELGKEAAARVRRGKEEPAFWNLGIAATMLRDWETARDSWAAYGLTIPAGTGEIVADFGPTCVRIDTGDGEEVVWAKRICPTRARVISVPFHPARRFGEVVVHDGVPNGERIVSWGKVAVFDEIALFTPSETATLSVDVNAAGPDDLEALSDLFHSNDFGFDALSGRVDLCKCCSEGSVTQERTSEAGDQRVYLGAPVEQARSLLDQWRAAQPSDRSWSNLHLAE